MAVTLRLPLLAKENNVGEGPVGGLGGYLATQRHDEITRGYAVRR